MSHHKFYIGDSLTIIKSLPSESVNCCVTSPPYWGLRDYGVDGQLGLEKTPEEYVTKLVEVFREIKRVLRGDGTIWLNLGDSYAGSGKGIGSNHGKAVFTDENIQKTDWRQLDMKPKDLVGIPWRVAFALQADGWYLRSDIIWHKLNPMPESVTDRPTKAHEYIFLLSKKERYYYDYEAILEPAGEWGERDRTNCKYNQEGIPIKGGPHHGLKGKPKSGNKERKYGSVVNSPNDHMGRSVPWEGEARNKRTVWTVATEPFPEAHFATYPTALIEPCILAGCPVGGTVLDPFGGSGTTTWVANKHGRNSIYIDLNPEYLQIALRRNGFTKDRLFDNSTYEVLEVAHETI